MVMPPYSQKVTEGSPMSLREAVTVLFKCSTVNRHDYRTNIYITSSYVAMKSNKLFIYTHVSEKLIIDKRGGTAAHRRVDRTSPYTFLPFGATWRMQPFKIPSTF